MRTRAIKTASLTLAMIGFIALSAGPVQASGDPITQHEGGEIDPSVSIERAELEELAGTQTPDEIAALLDSGAPVSILIDSNTNETIAVIEDEPVVQARLVQHGGGCTSKTGDGAQLTRSVGGRGTPVCFSGTGALSTNVPNTYYVTPGQISTRIEGTVVGSGTRMDRYVFPGQTAHFSPYVNVTRVFR